MGESKESQTIVRPQWTGRDLRVLLLWWGILFIPAGVFLCKWGAWENREQRDTLLWAAIVWAGLLIGSVKYLLSKVYDQPLARSTPLPAHDFESVRKNAQLIWDIKKTEYQTAAVRYENLYRSIWQQFSYMSLVAGGILTLGSRILPMSLVVPLGLAPLVFWYWATFQPLDHYGDKVRQRLADIENEVNSVNLLPDLGESYTLRLKHFSEFRQQASILERPRVQYWVHSVGTGITSIWILGLLFAFFTNVANPTKSTPHVRVDSTATAGESTVRN